jgi:NAD+ synthase
VSLCSSRIRDAARVADTLALSVRTAITTLGRRGAVLGVSGGVDSSVCAALCVRAVGADRVLGLRMPERDIGGDAADVALRVCDALGIRTILEPITTTLESLGCYQRRDDVIRSVVADYQPSWRHKLVRSAPGGVVVFSLVVERPDGATTRHRLAADAYRALVAATNMKQRVRKLVEYSWADREGYAVIGTPNRLEFDQGFFVKDGDGLADIKPIARLSKHEVYQLAETLGLPIEVRRRTPTTETFSLPQTQEEFYFGYPLETMDLLVDAADRDASIAETARLTGLSEADAASGLREVRRRRVATAYLHAAAIIPDPFAV